MNFDTIEAVRAARFSGFQTIRELLLSKCDAAPDVSGVYVIVRGSAEPPTFLGRSPGGRFKGRDPTVPIDRLRAEWVQGVAVLYIGEAGGGSSGTLRKRIASCVRFGSGDPAGHWGGRLVWQLADAGDLLVAWKPAGSADARELKKALILEFVAAHGRRPFANLKD